MNIMFYNYKGLAGTHKKSVIKRVVYTEHPEFLLLQETLGVGQEAKTTLDRLLPGCIFTSVDAMGRYGGFSTGSNSQKVKVLTWGLDSGIGIMIILPALKETVHLLNIYGPYLNKKHFWETLLKKSFFNEILILGGDLNLSLGPSEVWGGSERPDPLDDCFDKFFAEANLTDLDPLFLKPTWKNNRIGSDGVENRLDLFLINDSLMNNSLTIK